MRNERSLAEVFLARGSDFVFGFSPGMARGRVDLGGCPPRSPSDPDPWEPQGSNPLGPPGPELGRFSGPVKGLDDAERGILDEQFRAVVLLHPQLPILVADEAVGVIHRFKRYPARFGKAVDALERGVLSEQIGIFKVVQLETALLVSQERIGEVDRPEGHVVAVRQAVGQVPGRILAVEFGSDFGNVAEAVTVPNVRLRKVKRLQGGEVLSLPMRPYLPQHGVQTESECRKSRRHDGQDRNPTYLCPLHGSCSTIKLTAPREFANWSHRPPNVRFRSTLVSADPHKILPRSAEDKRPRRYADLTIFKVTAWTLCYKFLPDFYSVPSVRRINRRCLDAARLTPKSGRLWVRLPSLMTHKWGLGTDRHSHLTEQ